MAKIKISVLSASFFLLASPFWAPHVTVLGNANLFLSWDSMFALGAALFLGYLSAYFLPDSFAVVSERLALAFSRHIGIIGCIFLLLAGLSVLWINRFFFHSFMNSADEHSCYFLAECLRLGKLWVAPHPLSEFFNVVHVGNRDGKWFSVYPPGWPAIMAFGIQFGVLDWMNPVLFALSLALLYLSFKKSIGTTAAWLSLFLAALTPFFRFNSAGYFSHPACLLMISLFLYAFLRWRESKSERSRVIWSLIAGAAVGYGLNTRYLTMAAFAAPFILYHYLPLILRREKWKPSDIAFVAVASFFVLLTLLHNYAVTGKPFRAPNKHDKSWERLGFRKNYTPVDGLIFILARLFYLSDWAPPVLIVFFMASFFIRREISAIHRLIRGGLVYIAFGYFFYFSWGGNQCGPRYYYEGFPFLVFAAVDGLREWWNRGDKSLQKFILGTLVVSLMTNGYLFWKHAVEYEELSRQRKDLYVTAEKTVQKPAIVFIKGFLGDRLVMSEDDAVRNSPSLDAAILYARDLGGRNTDLMAAYPGRSYYRGSYDRKTKRAVLSPIYSSAN